MNSVKVSQRFAAVTSTSASRSFGLRNMATAVRRMDQIKLSIDTAMDDFKNNFLKFNAKGNKAAGTRARKALLDLKNCAHEMRLAITEERTKK